MNLTPKEIVAELDKYIIGQHNAKKNVAIALRNRWRRMNSPIELRNEINPNNILMIGATGVGKTEIARRLASIAQAPFTKVEASKFTEVGYVGRDVESMVRDLVEQSVSMVSTEKKAQVEQLAIIAVEDIILNALIPPVTGSLDQGEKELNEQTRARFRVKIKSGDLDDKKIEINLAQKNNGNVGITGPGMDEASMMNIQEMISGMLPKKTKTRRITVAEAKKLLLEEESSKLIDMEEVKEEAIFRAENTGIIFIDEIDKIASGGNKNQGGDVSREGVQRDLLPIVEGSTVTTKYGIINTDHVLFIAAGAFHFSKPSDLIPELQGRFPIRVELETLTKDDFYQILKEPKNALTKQYIALLASEEVTLEFTDEALKRLAEMAFEVNVEMENIGARRLHTVMSQLLNEILFEVPDTIKPNAHILINQDLVNERLAGMIKNRDLSEFIL